jgi:DNA-binding protein HU-beta
MKKSDISSHVASQGSLSKAAADGAVNAVFSAISDALAREEAVTIAGFGTFSTKRRPARQGRNPRTGESITIAASKVPSFKAGKTLRDTVN